MAFNRSGWRKLVFGNDIYHWQVDGGPGLFQVRPDREPHRRLCVACNQCECGGGFHGIVTPGVVRVGVECATDHGWPEQYPAMRVVVFSDPLRCIGPRPHWRTSATVAIAEGIYAERAFDRLPILADALQEAGCDNADVLDHCRGPGPHARGCWVVDLILGKT